MRVNAPDLFSGREIEAVQRSFGAERVDVSSGNGGRGAGSFVEAEIVAVMRGIVERPNRASSGGIYGFDDLFIREAMEQYQAVLRYNGCAEALADVLFPDD